MSSKTPRPVQNPALVPPTRLVLKRTPLVACMAGLLALAPLGSFALELGEATIRSALGESLAIHVPYRLASGEQLAPACIALAPAGRGDRTLPTYSGVRRIAITATHIEIYGDARVLEPLIGVTVDVHCATAPRFARSYQLFVDPPSRMPSASSDVSRVAATLEGPPEPAVPISQNLADAPAATRASRTLATSEQPPRDATAPPPPRPNVSARARGQTGGSLAQGQTYTVVRGDTLSGIAARVADRSTTIRETAEAIFAANPDAFTRGNPDLIEAGSALEIPFMSSSAAAPAVAPALAEPPAPAVQAAVPTAVESAATAPSAPEAATPPPADDRLPALPFATPAPSAAASETIAATEAPNPSLTMVPAAQSSSSPATPSDTAAAGADEESGARTSPWLTVFLALGAAILLTAPILLIRRRRLEGPAPTPRAGRASPPRAVVDPAAGFDVVEGQLGRTQSNAKVPAPIPVEATLGSLRHAAHAAATAELAAGATDTVDLDIGAPLTTDEDVAWFADRTDTAATSATASELVGHDTFLNAPTALLPQPETAPRAADRSAEDDATVAQESIDDEQHTLTIVELDMLRQDYEAEHTLTQQTSKALQAAVADLKATQAARAAGGETATLEMPQQPSDAEEQPARRASGPHRRG